MRIKQQLHLQPRRLHNILRPAHLPILLTPIFQPRHIIRQPRTTNTQLPTRGRSILRAQPHTRKPADRSLRTHDASTRATLIVPLRIQLLIYRLHVRNRDIIRGSTLLIGIRRSLRRRLHLLPLRRERRIRTPIQRDIRIPIDGILLIPRQGRAIRTIRLHKNGLRIRGPIRVEADVVGADVPRRLGLAVAVEGAGLQEVDGARGHGTARRTPDGDGGEVAAGLVVEFDGEGTGDGFGVRVAVAAADADFEALKPVWVDGYGFGDGLGAGFGDAGMG